MQQLEALSTTTTHPSFDLSVLAEYNRLTEVEAAIKKRKDSIKKDVKKYLVDNNLRETLPYNDLVGTLEERTSIGLNQVILEAALPPHIFKSIVEQKIDLDKVKEQFLDGKISVNLLNTAETISTSDAFFVRSAVREVKSNQKPLPFWRVR